MKMNLKDTGDLLIGLGTVYFIIRSIFSNVSPDKSYATDLLGFPLLDQSQEVTVEVWILSIIGAVIPFLIIATGFGLKRIAERRKNYEK